jgi:hypothetical protein
MAMTRIVQWGGQIAVYGLFAALLGIFSDTPSYRYFPPEQALVKLSFAHGAARKGECRRLSPEELRKLAPNMRKPVVCPRERLPVHVELEMDGALLYSASLPPTGLSNDGPSQVYKRFAVSAGKHRLTARLRDSARESGFDYERETTVELAAGRSFAIDFRADMGGFVFE